MEFRKAMHEDLKEIVRLLADDELGATREKYEDPLPDAYEQAFSDIQAQTGNQILVAAEDGSVIGCLQLTFIPGLSRLGMKRAQIEGVRIDKRCRGRKIGESLIREAIRLSQAENCGLIQLTTDKTREDAMRFYEKLGFTATHEGMKLILE
ncbi:GNAT family N-acetyltransferase [Bhargavaea cecembensis]|uniref:GNAT family N-acetyltransferase n=1 Tax=Bhargavaea cecembensis TaxID=394098 RepID=UPI00058E1EA8|nr:GNAT family N-acetyltransferase [Bhargavaea cecembensis]